MDIPVAPPILLLLVRPLWNTLRWGVVPLPATCLPIGHSSLVCPTEENCIMVPGNAWVSILSGVRYAELYFCSLARASRKGKPMQESLAVVGFESAPARTLFSSSLFALSTTNLYLVMHLRGRQRTRRLLSYTSDKKRGKEPKSTKAFYGLSPEFSGDGIMNPRFIHRLKNYTPADSKQLGHHKASIDPRDHHHHSVLDIPILKQI